MLLQACRSRRARIRSAGTVAEWVWLLPLLPLLGFVINGLLSLVERVPRRPGGSERAAHGDDHGARRRTRTTTAAARTATITIRSRATSTPGIVEHRRPGACSLLSFALAVAIFFAMRGVGAMHAPFVQTLLHAGCRSATCRSTRRSSSTSSRW